jgi:hypothetical protein
MRFDIFGIVGIDDLSSRFDVAGAATTYCLVAKNPVVFAERRSCRSVMSLDMKSMAFLDTGVRGTRSIFGRA